MTERNKCLGPLLEVIHLFMKNVYCHCNTLLKLGFSKVSFLLFCIEASFVLIPDTSFTEVIDFIQSSKKKPIIMCY